MKNNNSSKVHEPLFHIAKRGSIPFSKALIIRLLAIVAALALCGVLVALLMDRNPADFYSALFNGSFGSERKMWKLFKNIAVLLCISVAVTPAFRMKFWNIGAEGQILIGCLASAGIAKFMPRGTPNTVILIICAIASIVAGVIWSVIPAIFKAFLNTNETLFTLMMNYIATIACSLAISVWIKSGSQTFGMLNQGTFHKILGSSGTLVIVFGALIFLGMFFFITKSKHGYEISVVGESINTARYIGINVKKVIIRTMIQSGCICGFLGFLLVCGVHRSFSPTIVGGKGFTGVLIAWLGHFDPLEAAFYAFLSAVFERGTTTAATAVKISSSQFSAICTGMFFFIIISCEFFSRYQIKVHHSVRMEVQRE